MKISFLNNSLIQLLSSESLPAILPLDVQLPPLAELLGETLKLDFPEIRNEIIIRGIILRNYLKKVNVSIGMGIGEWVEEVTGKGMAVIEEYKKLLEVDERQKEEPIMRKNSGEKAQDDHSREGNEVLVGENQQKTGNIEENEEKIVKNGKELKERYLAELNLILSGLY
jgi:hypothetical protein